MYEMPKFKFNFSFLIKNIIITIIISCIFGFLAGGVFGYYFYQELREYLAEFNFEIPEIQNITNERIIEEEYIPQTSQEEKIIKVVEDYSPAVVSVIVTKDVPIMEQYYINPFGEDWPFQFQIPQYRQKGTEEKEVGGGSGFIISEDGMVLTNKHVVLDVSANYTVFTNDGASFTAEVLARDPFQDIAVLKIKEKGSFSTVKLGDSSSLQIGQTVVAIGNALGEFKNTVSVGVISGLDRTITATGNGFTETIEGVIQTDAAINAGNSGGPLLNLRGEVIGINTAMAGEAENIGFAIPINKATKDIEQVKTIGRIARPFLGIRYVLINDEIKQENDLSVDYGAWIISGNQGEPAVSSNSPAEKAGLKEGDIVLEFNNERITTDNSLAKIIAKYDPDNRIKVKILRDDKEQTIWVVLSEREE
jgi:serine protease Do